MVQVKVNEGLLEGVRVDNDFHDKPFYSFKGIPYAEPPIGDLRFKAPIPKSSWQGVRSVTEHGPQCYQVDTIMNQPPSGSEDCLYLNVYTPELSPIKPLPVMVFIHGGGFFSGNGNDSSYGPHYLVRKNVILVTLNYRLESLGFLCLDTPDVPGNAGLKDQVLALKWVKSNIRAFGGDPGNITIFGESAGSVSVNYHLISPMSKGLFRRGIAQSGSPTATWANSALARERGLALARSLGCYSENNKEVYEFLKSQPVENIVGAQAKITFAEDAAKPMVKFGPVYEKTFLGEQAFVTGDLNSVLKNGIHKDVEVMIGYNEDEGLFAFCLMPDVQKVLYQVNNMYEYLLPLTILGKTTQEKQIAIAKEIKNRYFKTPVITKNELPQLANYFSMEIFVHSILVWAKAMAATKKNKLYLYKFTCKSELNRFIDIIGLVSPDYLQDRTVVCHADELGYMLTNNYMEKVDMNSETFKYIENTTTLWTNFAKYGNPTPDNSLGIVWEPYTTETQKYLNIGEKLVAGSAPDDDEYQFWEKIHQF